MPIRVNCRHCGKQFSAWEDLAGQTVQCPKCKNRMIVAGGAAGLLDKKPAAKGRSGGGPERTDLGALDEAVDDLPSLDELVSKHPATEADSDALPSFGDLTQEGPLRAEEPVPSPPVAAAATPPPIASAKPNAKTPREAQPKKPNTPAAHPSDAFDDSDDLPIVCPNCNEPISGGEEFCDACGYHRILKKVLDFEGVRRTSKKTGFERAFDQQLSTGVTAENALLWLKVVAGFGSFVLLAFIWMCMGPLAAVFCLMCLGGGITWLFLRSKNQAASSVNRDAVSDSVWSVLLSIQRAIGWRLPEWPFPATRALTMNDPGFEDDDLAEVDVSTLQTLDLERTRVSDRGLVHLAKAKQLRFLVLRDTQVTAAGILRLQSKHQQLMIWH